MANTLKKGDQVTLNTGYETKTFKVLSLGGNYPNYRKDMVYLEGIADPIETSRLKLVELSNKN